MSDQICRYCGCSDVQSCVKNGKTCYWILDDVCSSEDCVNKLMKDNPGLSIYIESIIKNSNIINSRSH